MIKVEAINNESMWVDEKRVVMVGPLMDRGLRQLGRAVLYFDGLPPLPVKETIDELAERVEKGTKRGNTAEDPGVSDGADERAAGGAESRLVVEG
jgi:hypothetical protein